MHNFALVDLVAFLNFIDRNVKYAPAENFFAG
jgi:hypothetical protein